MKVQHNIRKRITATAYILIFAFLLPTMLLTLFGCGNPASDFLLPTRTLPENAEKQSYSYFRYKIYDDDTVIITEYKGEASEVVIPDEIEGRPVVALAEQLFYQNPILTSVTLGKNLEVIERQCFNGCSYLTDVKFGEKVWSIGAYAFAGTPWFEGLTDEFVTVGNGVLIKYNGKEDAVTIPDFVYHISDAFNMRGIVSVTMSDSVRTIGENAFFYCAQLTLVNFSNTLLLIDDEAFRGCSAITAVTVPSSVEKIDEGAFYECMGLNTVRLSDSLTELGTQAFYGCTQIRMLYLPTSLEELPVGAFELCSSLELVLYAGDEKTFKEIVADTSNFTLLDALIIYNAASGG